MKKIGFIFIFIFLTGLFTGLFFSTNLSDENNSYLSSLLLSDFASPSSGFVKALSSALISNFTLILLMLPAIFTKYLCPLPPLLLWYKSFAIGFCCGLVYINASDNAFMISVLKILPQNLFFIPSFIVMAMVTFYWSVAELSKRHRPSQEKNSLLQAAVIAGILAVLGCLTESICHLIAL